MYVWRIREVGAMHLDVQDLRNFYYREPLGRAAQRALRNKVLQFWPDLSGQTIAGFGIRSSYS